MLDYNNMIKRAIEFFPVWSDIRKRYKKSIGGKLLSTVTDMSLEINNAIQEYKDYYFLDRQQPKDIVDFCYCVTIGIIDDSKDLSVEYNNTIFKIESNLKNFLENNEDNIFYYENGKIYIKEEKYTTPNIKIIYDDSYLEFQLEKTHIWNIYDEFACFIGIQRHTNETNEELYKRMMYFNDNKPNSSIEGLKNAIMSELMIYENEISKDEILIEKVNETNLRKAYESFNELLEFLNKINRDVYRWKRWDLDVWEYDFENYTIEYLPYKWNEALLKWQNGIGYDDDLKVILSSNINKTNADITLYKKDKETLYAYIRRKNIYKNIKLIFESYNEKLNSINVKYLIKASPMKQLDSSKINLNIYEKSTVSEVVNIEDIFEIGKNLSKVENSKITDTYPYKLQFVPKDNNFNMEIYKCSISYRNKTTKEIIDVQDLLKETSEFKLNASGNLINNSTKKTIRSTNNMISYSNLENINVNEGFTVKNGYTIGQGGINANGLGKNIIHYTCECKTSSLDKSYIKTKNCIWKDDKLHLRNDVSSAKVVEIEINANKISFDINLNNNLLVYQYNFETNNYEAEEISSSDVTWSSKETTNPRNIKILISSVSSDEIILSNFLYSKYSVDFNVSNGVINKVDDKLYLPNEIYNTLFVTIKSYSAYSPVIKSIYLGENIQSSSYVTDISYYKNNCERIFEIKSNCKVNLIKVNSSGTPISVIEDYSSSTTYKALGDDSYIRLNLDEWESITSINTSSGAIEYIEESGKIYYNLKLKNGESISNIIVNGNKKIPTTSVTLEALIKNQLPDFNITKDKVYCSKLLKGIIVSINEENSYTKIIKINKDSFKRINAYKYEFTQLPTDLNVIWGTNESNLCEGFSTEGDFEYISFYPANAIIHSATNEYELFLNEIKDIKIINNFYPLLNTDTLNYYTVEPYQKDKDNIEIKFYNQTDEGRDFKELNNWSIGLKNLYIKYNADLFNKNIYEITQQSIQENVKLDSYIEIKDQYVLTNNNVLYTPKYKIIPPIGAEIIYQTYDGTKDTQDLLIDEIIPVENYFTKLKYVNIDKVFYVKEYYNSNDMTEYNSYSILKDEGIIVWNKYNEDKNKNIFVHIKYSIKKQVALSYGTDILYDIIPYNINAYKELSTYTVNDMENGKTYNLNNFEDYKDSDLVYVSCSEPSFEAQIEGNYLKFNKYAEENKLLIKTGYYYINGKEYYLFSNDGVLDIDTYSGMSYKNINFNNGEIQTYKETNNYVRNSSMSLSGMNDIYNYNYKEDVVNDISNFNKFTSCDSFNDWNNFGCKMKLTSNDDTNDKYSINDVALEFIFEEEWGYAYIDITDYLHNDSYMSFIAYGLDTYIGTEEKYEGLNFSRTINIKLGKLITSENQNKIVNIKKEADRKYYLVIKKQQNSLYNNHILDDIIISNTWEDAYNLHTKNIDLLDFKFNNNKTELCKYRMSIPSNKYCYNYFASICSDKNIKTTSNIDWGLTILKNYETKDDFIKCELDNLKLTNNYIKAPSNDSGYLTTEPIFINDPYTIKRIFFKINNINIDEMIDIRTLIYTCDEINGDYKLAGQSKNNYGFVYGYNLNKYIKIKLEIPKNKIVDNLLLFAEYRSTKENPLMAITKNTGYIISKVFDTQECLNYQIKSINILNISNINDVEIYIRSASDKYSADVWNNWKKIELTNSLKIKNEITFENSRFFQIKILLKTSIAYINFDYIEIEVI